MCHLISWWWCWFKTSSYPGIEIETLRFLLVVHWTLINIKILSYFSHWQCHCLLWCTLKNWHCTLEGTKLMEMTIYGTRQQKLSVEIRKKYNCYCYIFVFVQLSPVFAWINRFYNNNSNFTRQNVLILGVLNQGKSMN